MEEIMVGMLEEHGWKAKIMTGFYLVRLACIKCIIRLLLAWLDWSFGMADLRIGKLDFD